MLSRFASTVLVLGLVALLSHAAAGSAQGQPPPSHQQILNALNPWSQILPGAGRFESALNGAAVLDKETGLVWEQAPDSDSVVLDRKSWFAARAF
jgi:hypothetical protein